MTQRQWWRVVAIFAAGTLFGVVVTAQIAPHAKTSTEVLRSGSESTNDATGDSSIAAGPATDATAGGTTSGAVRTAGKTAGAASAARWRRGIELEIRTYMCESHFQ